MQELPIQTFEATDGAPLSYVELGEGPAVVLLHGYLMTAHEAWVRTGIAERLAAAGRRAVMPDMRGHGGSAPSDAAAYRLDILVDDGFALVDHLGLEDPDLVGYSMGSVMVARMVVRGARPGRVVIGGTGLEPIIHMTGRGRQHHTMLADPGSAQPGTAAGRTDAYLDRIGADRVALRRILDTFVDTPIEALGEIEAPVLLLFGEEEDEARGSVEDLAEAIPRATIKRVPGDHITAPRSPEFAEALVEFLRA
ncbi:MAG: alpha/beta hydrolase [Actinobacteria bacterium]|nr:alpha/beta hydrolase [Actinomycetota bacterium]